MSAKTRILMDAQQMERTLERIAAEILERGAADLALVGIRTRGVHLAQRLWQMIRRVEDTNVDLGILDINLYRDDLSMVADHPVLKKTEIPFAVGGKRLVLVDDVLYTGRTIRAALDAVVDLGRPRAIELVVMVDRGHRELPIRADYVGLEIPTQAGQHVRVLVQEEDQIDRIELGDTED
ncbi:MAG: bifunctional pyr operon transcriptional regulator/uracil phosphoribosyltransferase PyrR [Acidobacteriota bacterium]